MNAGTLHVGDQVIFHDDVGELPAVYIGHDAHGVVVEIYGVPYTVRWESRHMWISTRATGEAYTFTDPEDPVLETLPPDRE
jgi:hypothetical protein